MLNDSFSCRSTFFCILRDKNGYKIIIAQRVSSIEDADQIIVLDGGQIMGIGTSEELLKTNEIYREVYESQVKGGGDHE